MPRSDASDPPGIVPDDLPKRNLFSEPIVVATFRAKQPVELDDGRVRIAFRATVKDAVGRRVPELAVEARIVGPERTGEGTAWTNLMGAVEFQMDGPPGTYRCELLDVAAGGLDLDRDASQLRVETTV